MSALEQGSSDSNERRSTPRLRVAGTIPVLIGRGEGVMIDLSERGTKVRHSATLRRGAMVRVSFEWQRARFGASAEVLASRLVSLGNDKTPAMYETRLRFRGLDEGAKQVLVRALEALAGRDMRRWVANMRGWSDETQNIPVVCPGVSFIRCRLAGVRWEVKSTQNATQPEDGFVLPATLDDNEIVKLCADYFRADTDGRHVIRLLAAAAVEQAIEASNRHQPLARPA